MRHSNENYQHYENYNTEPLSQPYNTQPLPQAYQQTNPSPVKKSKTKKTAPLLLSALLGGTIATGGNVAYEHFKNNGNDVLSSSDSNQNVVINNADKVNGTTAVAKKSLPSVVTIGISAQNGQGSGSGVVIDDQGHILTNNHVVTGDGQVTNPSIQVRDSNGKVYDATLVGSDPESDLAVLKVEGANLPAIEFGDSNKLNVGQVAVAIGAPLGLSESVTDGIISSLSRTISVQTASASDSQENQSQENQNQSQENPFQFQLPEGFSQQKAVSTVSLNVIQTDAAINPGNSGGALLDSEGKLIGINVAIASTSSSSDSSSSTSGNIGVGFAIPSDYAQRIANEIIKDQKVSHGWIGATIQSHPANNSQNSTFSDGAIVGDITSGSPMANAGFKSGDIITNFNGKQIPDAATLTATVRETAPNTQVEVTYIRDGKEQKTTVTVGENQE
ncbi:MAG: trypsin-like peptidase domain-containing protein [Micrococcaceae bacterium]